MALKTANQRGKVTHDACPIILSEQDYKRLQQLVDENPSPNAALLEEELTRGTIVKNAPADTVSMNSTVTFEDMDSGKETTITLVYPHEAEVASSRISILSPVGSALIGLSLGGFIVWPMHIGKPRRLKVIKVSRAQETAA